jgi:putative copper resistance protein D
VINFLRALSAGQEARILSPLVEPSRAWLAAPDFTFAVGPSPARSLKELRGRRTVLLVLFSLPDSAARMRELALVYGELQFLGTEIIAVPMSADPGILARLGGDPPVLYPVVTDGAADIARAYALFGRTLAPAGLRPDPPVPAHMELLIDRQGYIRARWIPGEGRPSWSDLKILRDEIQILAGEVAAPPPDEHVH